MKYINQLNDEQIVELVKIYCGENEFRRVSSFNRDDNEIDITVEIEFEDDDTGETVNCEDSYTLKDYNVIVHSWSGDESAKKCLILYRQWLLNKFGNQYAVDYLVG